MNYIIIIQTQVCICEKVQFQGPNVCYVTIRYVQQVSNQEVQCSILIGCALPKSYPFSGVDLFSADITLLNLMPDLDAVCIYILNRWRKHFIRNQAVRLKCNIYIYECFIKQQIDMLNTLLIALTFTVLH